MGDVFHTGTRGGRTAAGCITHPLTPGNSSLVRPRISSAGALPRRVVGFVGFSAIVAAIFGAGSGIGGTTNSSAVQQQQPQRQRQARRNQLQPHAGMGTAAKLMSGMRSSQDELVDYLIRSRLVKTQRVADAMRAVDRGRYIDPTYASQADAYQDHPLAIGLGQTISAPHMHAICLELLQAHAVSGARVLDVGSGSGYLAACLAKLVAPSGAVLGVDKVPELVLRSRDAIAQANPELLPPGAAGAAASPGDGGGADPLAAAAPAGQQQQQQAGGGDQLLRIVHGNVLGDILSREAPFQAIHVGAAADELHQVLLDSLAPGGRMVIPIGPHYAHQVLTVVDRDMAGQLHSEALMDVGYVPLTRPADYEDGCLPGP